MHVEGEILSSWNVMGGVGAGIDSICMAFG